MTIDGVSGSGGGGSGDGSSDGGSGSGAGSGGGDNDDYNWLTTNAHPGYQENDNDDVSSNPESFGDGGIHSNLSSPLPLYSIETDHQKNVSLTELTTAAMTVTSAMTMTPPSSSVKKDGADKKNA